MTFHELCLFRLLILRLLTTQSKGLTWPSRYTCIDSHRSKLTVLYYTLKKNKKKAYRFSYRMESMGIIQIKSALPFQPSNPQAFDNKSYFSWKSRSCLELCHFRLQILRLLTISHTSHGSLGLSMSFAFSAFKSSGF